MSNLPRPDGRTIGGNIGRLLPRLLAAAAVCVLLLPDVALPHGSCTAVRMKNAGKRCRSIARCFVREATGREDLAPCVAYELQRLQRHFQETTIYPDCHPFGDPPDVIASIEQYLGDAATLLQLGTDRCSRSKMEAAGKLCLHLLRDCEAPAEVEDVPADPACLGEESALLAKAFDKAELKYTCATVDDEAGIETSVQNAVDAVVIELDEP